MKTLVALIAIAVSNLFFASQAQAARPALGIHLLDPNELGQAAELVAGDAEHPGAVTVVLRADDRDPAKWQAFFDLAHRLQTTPIIRLATEMSPNGWRKPVKSDVLDHAAFLARLEWYEEPLTIVAFNEPNQASEWGGQVDPEGYARLLEFTANWFHTEAKSYRILPAGLDAAAPTGPTTMDSLAFLKRLLAERPELVESIDGWVSHAYPNPGFSAPPYRTGKQSIRSYQHELVLLRTVSGREFDVYITETGWKSTPQNAAQLSRYYTYAVQRVWNDERIKAVTPFVFSAPTGPFQPFSFLGVDGSPTPRYLAWKMLKKQASPPTPALLAAKE